MRKKQLVTMLNEANATLDTIYFDLIDYIEGNGGEWVDHGTDDHNRVCFQFQNHIVGVSTHTWDVDGKTVSFFMFLATITQE
jgi:hypothetical protein